MSPLADLKTGHSLIVVKLQKWSKLTAINSLKCDELSADVAIRRADIQRPQR
jgi:hypothetical protein